MGLRKNSTQKLETAFIRYTDATLPVQQQTLKDSLCFQGELKVHNES
jgi:hypothetical protein